MIFLFVWEGYQQFFGIFKWLEICYIRTSKSTVINAIKISIEKEYSNLSDFFIEFFWDIFHPITYKLRTFTLALTSPFQWFCNDSPFSIFNPECWKMRPFSLGHQSRASITPWFGYHFDHYKRETTLEHYKMLKKYPNLHRTP